MPSPATSYAEAVRRIESGISHDTSGDPLRPNADTIFLGHGHRTDQAFILLHGFTISPHQFRQLGELIHSKGHNVLIPRMPNHGLTTMLNDALKHLTRSRMVDYANGVVDAAAGLGERLTAIGLSAGGVLASYMGSFRPEIDQVEIISPALAIHGVPPALNGLVNTLASSLPNRNVWWDGEAEVDETAEGYPRFSTKGLAGVMRVGEIVIRRARQQKPYCSKAILVMNDNDFAVQPAAAHALFDAWEARGVDVKRFTFDRALNLDHDCIAPWHPLQNTELVYPKLLSLLN